MHISRETSVILYLLRCNKEIVTPYQKSNVLLIWFKVVVVFGGFGGGVALGKLSGLVQLNSGFEFCTLSVFHVREQAI